MILGRIGDRKIQVRNSKSKQPKFSREHKISSFGVLFQACEDEMFSFHKIKLKSKRKELLKCKQSPTPQGEKLGTHFLINQPYNHPSCVNKINNRRVLGNKNFSFVQQQQKNGNCFRTSFKTKEGPPPDQQRQKKLDWTCLIIRLRETF